MPASELLSGPRGRRLCWHLFGTDGYVLSERTLPAAWAELPAVLERLQLNDAVTEELVHEALIFAVDVARYWQEPDEIDEFLTTPELLPLLRPVAEAICATTAVRWWASPIDLGDQWIVRFVDDDRKAASPELSAVRSRLDHQHEQEGRQNDWIGESRVGDVDWLRMSGRWWSTPDRLDVPLSARSRRGSGPVGLSFIEDSMGWTRAVVWAVHATHPPRVHEITGPESWAELTRRHPLDVSDGRGPDWFRATGRVGRWLLPDWSSVATEFDAVHVSVAGYLTTAGLAVPVDDTAATVLAGWAPDQCWWLTDNALELAGPGVAWAWPQRGESYIWQRVAD